MKTTLLSFLSLSFIVLSCKTAVIETSDGPQIVGNDVDANGCKGSAGYVYSVIKAKCIRAFEEGIEFHNKDFSQSAYVVLSNDKKEAEVFLPIETTINECILQRLDDKKLYVNKHGTMEITKSESEFVLTFKKEQFVLRRTEDMDSLLLNN
jgi:hypothetical protein